jgi:diguanylate cyclase (GGDEF)-like protein
VKRSKQLEPIDSRQAESLRVFHEVARALTSSLEVNALLRAIMEQMEEFFDPEHWSLLIVDDEEQELYFALSAGVDPLLLKDLRLKLGEGIAGQVAQSGCALVIPDVSANVEWSAYAKEHPELNLLSIACLPIRHGDHTLGVLQLNNSKIDLLPDSSIAFLRVLCDYSAIALQNARHVRLIHQLSVTDDCTGLFNARHLYTLLDEEIAAASNPNVIPIVPPHFSLLFFDLDHFKSVNDVHGHLAGSQLLAEVGNLVKRTLGPNHAGFRYGGDEFVCLLRNLDKPAATELAARIRDTLNSTRFLTSNGLSLALNASFGLSTFPQDGATLHDVIRTADTMMYAAKAAGRNQIVVADAANPIGMPSPRTSRHN